MIGKWWMVNGQQEPVNDDSQTWLCRKFSGAFRWQATTIASLARIVGQRALDLLAQLRKLLLDLQGVRCSISFNMAERRQ
jgi:hypothetical protein